MQHEEQKDFKGFIYGVNIAQGVLDAAAVALVAALPECGNLFTGDGCMQRWLE